MKVLITGGHLSPMLCVIDALPKDTETLIVGRKYPLEGDSSISFEYQTMQSRGIPFWPITTGRLQRKLTKHTIPSLLKIPVGFIQAYKAVVDFNPDVIISFGGYVSLPVILSGRMRGVPVVLHEQTLSAGLANRIGSLFATKVCVSWEQSRKFFPRAKTVLTGNPVRKFSIHHSSFIDDLADKHLPLLYITGGSVGSHTINKTVMQCVGQLLKKFRIIHQTGQSDNSRDFNTLLDVKQKLSQRLQKRYMLTKFVDAYDVGDILRNADLVISRCGINTLTELMYFCKPSILIPLNKEQEENALFLAKLGLAVVLFENLLTPQSLLKYIETHYNILCESTKHREEAQGLVTNDAAQRIVAILSSVVAG